MKKYEFVDVKMKGIMIGKIEEHRKIINEYAEKGYRYVGYIPTKCGSYGEIGHMDLIFEIEY